MTNKIFKFCNKVTSDPLFDSVVVFTITFLFASVLLSMSSALDGGVYCNNFDTEGKRSLCTKINGVIIVLSLGLPIILGISTYMISKQKKLKQFKSRKERLWYK